MNSAVAPSLKTTPLTDNVISTTSQKPRTGESKVASNPTVETEEQGRIQGAVDQNYHAGKLQTYYATWAETYDSDVASSDYQGPKVAAKMLAKFLPPTSDVRVVDIGCGTGLSGPELQAVGYEKIDGFDLSSEMTDIATKTGAYQELFGDIDLNEPFQLGSHKYNAAIATGVFTAGHVKPQSIQNVIPHMEKGAIIVITAREAYASEHGLDKYLEELESQGVLKTLAVERSLPYLDITKAHYYCLQVAA